MTASHRGPSASMPILQCICSYVPGQLLAGDSCSLGRAARWGELLAGESCSLGTVARWGELSGHEECPSEALGWLKANYS